MECTDCIIRVNKISQLEKEIKELNKRLKQLRKTIKKLQTENDTLVDELYDLEESIRVAENLYSLENPKTNKCPKCGKELYMVPGPPGYKYEVCEGRPECMFRRKINDM